MIFELHNGDCVEMMRKMPEASVDAVVTDPPYGLEFMGKEWDKLDINGRDRRKAISRSAFEPICGAGSPMPRIVRTSRKKCKKCGLWSGGTENMKCKCTLPDWEVSNYGRNMQAWHERWAREALRVLKPGGYLLAFGGTRTSHRLACAVEDAGLEIRDSILTLNWIHGQGFPKNTDVGRSIDMELCELPGRHFMRKLPPENKREPGDHVCPETPEGDEHRGEGSSLKPSHEPVVCAQKPLVGNLAQNVLKHGTGGINVDGCRVGYENDPEDPAKNPLHRKQAGYKNINAADSGSNSYSLKDGTGERNPNTHGRWPPNVVMTHSESCQPIGTRKAKGRQINRWKDGAKPFGGGAGHPYESEQLPDDEVLMWECVEDCPVAEMDRQSGKSVSTKGSPRQGKSGDGWGMVATGAEYEDSGGASRFFPCFRYEVKASRAERDAGCEELVRRTPGECTDRQDDTAGLNSPRASAGRTGDARNFHPTVKPIDLMRWLVRLVTPPGGVVLDPFMGSGTTGIACHKERFGFIGIELDKDYFKIAEARIAAARAQLRLF